MELIKKIKQTEAEARRIVEQAGRRSAELTEKGRARRADAVEQAAAERKRAIDEAVSLGQSQGRTEAEKLKAEAAGNSQQLRQKAQEKVPAAVAKVMEYLKG